jgi:hypothetical protein
VNAAANPFRASRIEAFRYQFLESDWDGLLARLAANDMRGAIVGPEGSGKTTLLEELGQRLGGDVVLLDGVDLLTAREWRRVLRDSARAAGLVVTAHREGFLPTILRTRTTPEILEAAVRAASGEGCASFGASSAELWERHGGNVRDALRELYDVCARRVAV